MLLLHNAVETMGTGRGVRRSGGGSACSDRPERGPLCVGKVVFILDLICATRLSVPTQSQGPGRNRSACELERVGINA